MLNNIHFVALHILMSTVFPFAISSQGRLVKFDAILILLIGYRFEFAAPNVCHSLV